VTLLLDTHTFLWFCQDDPSLSASAKALLEDPGHRKLVSLATCWEIAIEAGLGELALGGPSGTYIPNALASTLFEFLPMVNRYISAAEQNQPGMPGPQSMRANFSTVSYAQMAPAELIRAP